MAETARLRRAATYDDLCAVPDHQVAEILGGDLYASPRPRPPHAHAASVIGMDVGGAFHGSGPSGRGPGGWFILDEPELHLGDDVAVPDLAGWRRDRLASLPREAYFTLPPDWVCEVVSRSTGRLDRTLKMPLYARAGIGHLWIVDPLARTLEAYRLEAGRWVVAAQHGGDDVVRVEPFEAVELALDRFWPPGE